MFTSRAEFRILLRQDNADLRLTSRAFDIGLASPERMDRVSRKKHLSEALVGALRAESVSPEAANELIVPRGTTPIKQKVKLYDILLRPQINFSDIAPLSSASHSILSDAGDLLHEVLEQVEINVKYEGYLEKEREMAEKLSRLEEVPLDLELDYSRLTSLSIEARQKLDRIRPNTLGQASRISGVSPADLSVLMVYLGR